MDAILPTALLAIASALAWIAYTHPEGYKKLLDLICGLCAISFIFIQAYNYCFIKGWSSGVSHYSTLYYSIPPNIRPDRTDKYPEMSEWLFYTPILVFVYVWILKLVVHIIKNEIKKLPKKEVDNERLN